MKTRATAVRIQDGIIARQNALLEVTILIGIHMPIAIHIFILQNGLQVYVEDKHAISIL